MSIPLIHVGHFSDTCDDVQENVKIRSAYIKHLPRLGGVFPIIDLVPVKNTIDVGFNLSEAITNPEAAARMILIGNYAPPDNPNGTENNVRKSFYAAKLEFGGQEIPIVTTLNGFELSYLKSAVTELYEVKSDNGDQFRSLTLAPRTGVNFSDVGLRQHLLDEGLIRRLPDLAEIPDVPDVSHVVHVDNFKNIKVWFSKTDRELLRGIGEQRGEVTIEFLPASLDPHCTISVQDPSLGSFAAKPRPTLFKAQIGEKIVAQRSSSFFVDGTHVPQIVELRNDPVRDPVTFPIPHVGQRIQIQPGGVA